MPANFPNIENVLSADPQTSRTLNDETNLDIMKTALKLENDGLAVEFEMLPVVTETAEGDPRKRAVATELGYLNCQTAINQQQIDTLNQQIDTLTNHADGIDYIVAVGSGVLAGIIDSFWVGTFDFERGKAWSNRKVNTFVMKVAKSQGYEGDRLDGAIKFLEEKYKAPSDNIWKGQAEKISARSHHIDDLAHHPSPIGLLFSILTQFTKAGYFQNQDGTFIPIEIDENGEGLIGKDIPSKIFCGTVNWFFHLVSDMSGSNKTAGAGMGIPGPLMSLLKEVSAIPGLNKTGLAKQVHGRFTKQKFDLRSEMAVGHEAARQAVPVMFNEVLVRTFYFIRRVAAEGREKKAFAKIEWEKTLPWKNRTIVRMLTISSGTFTAVDLADAAIRAGIKSRGEGITFSTEFLLRVNFVGVGRFAIAVGSDVYMGAKREHLRNERIALYSQQLHLMGATVHYFQAGMWLSAETTKKTITEAYACAEQAVHEFQRSVCENTEALDKIGQYRQKVEENNPELINSILKKLEL